MCFVKWYWLCLCIWFRSLGLTWSWFLFKYLWFYKAQAHDCEGDSGSGILEFWRILYQKKHAFIADYLQKSESGTHIGHVLEFSCWSKDTNDFLGQRDLSCMNTTTRAFPSNIQTYEIGPTPILQKMLPNPSSKHTNIAFGFGGFYEKRGGESFLLTCKDKNTEDATQW